MEEKIVLILNEMSEYLSIAQMKKLQEVVLKTFSENEADKQEISNNDFLQMFLDAKRIEGCSERTIQYYHCGTFIFKNESECKEDYHGRDSYLFIRLSENKQVFKCDD